MIQTPLIVFAFAHERSETNPPVRNLLKEQLQVTSLVAPLVQQKYCETQAIVNVTVDKLNQLIEREGHRLIGLHYASDVATLLRSREGKDKSMERAFRGKAGRKLGALPHLKWIFLSGDGSQEQAESLLKAGIPLVVRSQNLINDDAAFRLSYFFYQSLGQGATLGKACERSISEVRRDYVNKAKLTYEHEPPSGYGSDWPFSYHVNPFLESPLWWSVHHAKGLAGDGLPRIEFGELPDLPFTDFSPLDSRFASMFVGKELEARSVYEMISSPSGPPIIVISGEPQSGKSSFARARLSHIFSRDYQYRYHSFEQDALSTLSWAISADEDLSLTRTWLEQEGGEERALLQPQMITELMNEAQSSFRTHYRSDKADFTQFLRAVRAMWMRDELGEGDNLLVRLGDLFNQQTKMTEDEDQAHTDLRPLIVCLDQMELMFDHHSSLTERRHERFWEVLKQLCFSPDHPLRGGLVLCVDSSKLTQLTSTLNRHQLSFESVNLGPLNRGHIESYLDQLRTSNMLKERYPLMMDEQVPNAWGQLLSQVPQDQLGYAFQEMFRYLWQKVSKRPLLLSVDLLHSHFPSPPSLSDLLMRRVRDFTDLMKAQGDDELSEEFALDLMYRMSNSVEESGQLEVSSFLHDYLKWDISLPNPWGFRQKTLGDQSLWVITQAIDLGLFRGQVKAGVTLPSGLLRPVHPSLAQVLKQEWTDSLGHYERAIERLGDYSKSDLAPSAEDIKLAHQAFQQMRLPTLEEAELLLGGLMQLEEAATRSQVSSKRDRLMQYLLIFGLLLTMGRCAQVGSSYEELSTNRSRVDDQLRLLAAERSIAEGEVDLAAALLSEVNSPRDRASWRELALQTLNTPLAISKVSANQTWEEALITPRAVKILNKNGQASLWTGKSLQQSHLLGSPQHIDHTESGQRWVSFDGGMLSFWSIDQGQPTSKRLKHNTIESLSLNHEGTIAAVLNTRGVVSLYRSYEYPVKEFTGLNNAPIEEVKLSPNRRHLMLIDKAGAIQSLNFAAEQIEMSIPQMTRFQLEDAQWIAGEEVRLVTSLLERDSLSPSERAQQAVIHTRGREPQILFQGRQSIQKMYSSRSTPQIALARSSARRQRSLEVYNLDQDRSKAIPALTLNGIIPKDIVFDPSGARIAIKRDPQRGGPLVYSLQARLQPVSLLASGIEQLRDLTFSDDGQYVIGALGEQVVQWNSQDGRVRQTFERREKAPLAIRVLGDYLQVAFSGYNNRIHSELLTWDLNADILGDLISLPDEEITNSLWTDNRLVTANQSGEVSMWDPSKRTLMLKFNAHQDRISALQLSPNQESFITAAADGGLSRWSTNEGKPLARYEGHKSGVSSLATPSNPTLDIFASGDQSGEVWLWSGRDGTGQHWQAARARIRHLSLSPQANYLATVPAGSRELATIWKIQPGKAAQKLATLPGGLCDAHWRGQGSELSLLSVACDGTIITWTPRGGRPQQNIALKQALGGVAFKTATLHRDDQHLLGVSTRGQAIIADYKAQTATPIISSTSVSTAHFASGANDGDLSVILGGQQGEVWSWQNDRTALLGRLEGSVVGLSISRDHQSFLSYSEALGVHWDKALNTEQASQKLKQKSRICLTSNERVRLLDEPIQVAKDLHQSCLNRLSKDTITP